MDLIDRINANYNNLSRVHKRIVDYITDNPDRACFQSLTQGFQRQRERLARYRAALP